MKVSIIGGTGKLGSGLAYRFHSAGHEVVLGSRDEVKAQQVASTIDEAVSGMTNADAAMWCDAAVIAVPYATHRTLLEPLRQQLDGKIVVDATVPIDSSNLLQIKTESGKSAAEETIAIVVNPVDAGPIEVA